MGFVDDFKQRIGNLGNDLRDRFNSDIDSYLSERAVDDFVKVGKELTGNLSQKELEQGKTGEAQPVVAAQPSGFSVSPMLIMVGVGLAAILLLSKKSRRG